MATLKYATASPRLGAAMCKMLLAVIVLALSFFLKNAYAGDVSFAVDANNRVFVMFTGSIEPGDATKLANKIEQNRYLYLWSHGLIIDSDGGSVVEAIKIGELIEKSGWRIDVQKGGVCASSCFLIYVAAPMRYSEGSVIIHRPYFLMNTARGENSYKIGHEYRETIFAVRSYLMAHLVPSYLVDIMMSKDSSQGYTLTPRDMVNLGFFSPALDEYQVQQCNFPTDHIATKAELDNTEKCRNKYLLQARIKFLYGKKYPEASKAVANLNEYLKVLPQKLSPDSTKYRETLLRIEHVVNTLPPRDWLSAIEHRK